MSFCVDTYASKVVLHRVVSCVVGCIALWFFPLFVQGHIHLEIDFTNNEWNLYWYDFDSGRIDPTTFPLVISPAALTVVPSDPRYSEALGTTGTPIWLLPDSEVAGIPFLGIGTRGIRSGQFLLDRIQLRLESFEGPGEFMMYTTDAFGNPRVHMNTKTGVDPEEDFIDMRSVAAHLHMNWVFTHPGNYSLRVIVTGINPANQMRISSPPVPFHFRVQPAPTPVLTLQQTEDGIRVLNVVAKSGFICHIESSTDLGSWRLDQSHKIPADGFVSSEEVEPTGSRYFRAYLTLDAMDH